MPEAIPIVQPGGTVAGAIQYRNSNGQFAALDTFVVDTNGYVGIGTASPSVHVHIAESANDINVGMTFEHDTDVASGGSAIMIFRSKRGDSRLSAFAYGGGGGGCFIQTGNYDFDGDVPLKLTGPNGSQGSDLVFKFDEVYVDNNLIVNSISSSVHVGTNGAGVVGVLIGTTPSSSPANMGQLYAANEAGDGTAGLYARDELGNVTNFSPHAMDAPIAIYNEPPGWEAVVGYRNVFRGEIRWVNLEDPSKGKIVETFAQYNTRRKGEAGHRDLVQEDWDANEQLKVDDRQREIDEWDAAEQKSGERPKPYVTKPNPFAVQPR